MLLLIGLGNPGEKYEKTRHNAGFLAADFLAAKFGFEPWRAESKWKTQLAAGQIAGEKVLLAKPQTFMNLSGDAARAILDFYKLEPSQILALHDDKDLPFGTLRMKENGGHGGHNGIRDLIAKLGTDGFARLKIGVASELLARQDTADFVLDRFGTGELENLPKLLEAAAEKAATWIKSQQ